MILNATSEYRVVYSCICSESRRILKRLFCLKQINVIPRAPSSGEPGVIALPLNRPCWNAVSIIVMFRSNKLILMHWIMRNIPYLTHKRSCEKSIKIQRYSQTILWEIDKNSTLEFNAFVGLACAKLLHQKKKCWHFTFNHVSIFILVVS